MHRSINRPDPVDHGPSRTRQRREALDVLALAQQLTELPPSRLARLELPDDVLDEIANIHRITAHGAHKRQLAYLAKLMRRQDDDVLGVARAELAHGSEQTRHETALLHRLEALRERLLGEGDPALSEFIAAHPGADRQRLRALIRQARIEREANKPLHAYRELFRMIRYLTRDRAE